MKYRTAFDIYHDILQFCADESRTKTKLTYGSKLGSQQVKAYLPAVVSAGLLREDGDKYFITPKGYEYLDTFQKLAKLMEA